MLLLLALAAALNPAPYDELIRGLMERYHIPGASVAVTCNGSPALTHSWGVPPDTRFRIASLSKSITAVTILRLVESGKLQLDAPALDTTNPRLRRITIRHLLHHQGGWDRALSGDPTFRYATVEEAIRATLRRPLDFEPGTRAVYSNFGYALLGRVIERATGLPYEQAVRQLVLLPAGLPGMFIDPALRRLDAHGGWLATPAEFVRFLNSIDGRTAPRLLTAASVATLTAAPPHAPSTEAWYAMGLNVRPAGSGANWWHEGALGDSSRTLAVRAHNGCAWAAFFNDMPPIESPFMRDLDTGLWRAFRQATALH